MAFNIKSIMGRNGGQQGPTPRGPQAGSRPSVQRPTAAPAAQAPESQHNFDFSVHDDNDPGQTRGSLRLTAGKDNMYDVSRTMDRSPVTPEERAKHGPNGRITETTPLGRAHRDDIKHDKETGSLSFNLTGDTPHNSGPRSFNTTRGQLNHTADGKDAPAPSGMAPKGLEHVSQQGDYYTPPKKSKLK